MIHDAQLPPELPPPPTDAVERHGILYTSAVWTGEALEHLALHLRERGRPALEALDDERILGAWSAAVEALLDPGSHERSALEPALLRCCGLSPQGLQAALEAVLGGVLRGADRLFAEAGEGPAGPGEDRPVLVVLASNLPALAVQPLLPALALRRPTILKSPTAEPFFAPAFVAALARREPGLAPALAAITWRGGERGLEDHLLPLAARILAYGEQESVDDLGSRAPGRVFPYGPRISLAAASGDVAPEAVAPGLARDVALFDQRGCLSVQAVYTSGPARPLAEALADELTRLHEIWPPGPADPVAAAGVQQLRAEADLRGLYRPGLAIGAGTVVVEPLPELRPSPGLRTVRVHPIGDLDRLPDLLAPWQDRLQGAALAGAEAASLRARLEALGITRCAPPGELQSADALWHNGGVHPLEALRG